MATKRKRRVATKTKRRRKSTKSVTPHKRRSRSRARRKRGLSEMFTHAGVRVGMETAGKATLVGFGAGALDALIEKNLSDKPLIRGGIMLALSYAICAGTGDVTSSAAIAGYAGGAIFRPAIGGLAEGMGLMENGNSAAFTDPNIMESLPLTLNENNEPAKTYLSEGNGLMQNLMEQGNFEFSQF